MRALNRIVDLSALFPEIHDIFRANNGLFTLETAKKISLFYGDTHHEILTASRQALVSIEENVVNKSAKVLAFGYGIDMKVQLKEFPSLRVSFTDRNKISFQTWNDTFDLMITYLEWAFSHRQILQRLTVLLPI